MRKNNPFAIAALSGFLLILTFPKPDLAPLAWIGIVPITLAALDEPKRGRRFLLGWTAGVIFFLGTCSWCFDVMKDFGKLSFLEASGVLAAMVAGLAVYWGIFSLALPAATGGASGAPWRVILGTASLWTATEYARGHIFIGFPWLFLGYATTDHLLPAQLAAYTGVYGLSFLVAAFNACVCLVIRNPTRAWGMRLAVCFLVLAALSGGGLLIGKEPSPESAYLMQPDLPVDLAPYQERERFPDMESRLVSAYARNRSQSGLVIWPETPGSFYYDTDPFLRSYLGRLAAETASHLVSNAVTFEDAARLRPFNSAVMISPEGKRLGKYDKIELVPFGEHVPYSHFFSFAGKLTSEVGDFVPGHDYTVLPGPGQSGVGVLICYEAGFPELARRIAERGAQVLVNISNDGWFGNSPARQQHLLMARMRAIETNRWLLRATNDGITAVIDPRGRVTGAFPEGRTGVFVAPYGLRTRQTLYTRWGDWFAYLCIAAAVALTAYGGFYDRRTTT